MDKSIIMVGGRGERLWPLTQLRPKPLVYAGGNKRILEYTVDGLVKAGFYDIHMASQYMKDNIMRCFGDGSDFLYEKEPLNIIYTFGLNDEMNGTADSIRKSRLWLANSMRIREKRTGKETELSGEEKQKFIEESYIFHPQHWEVLSYGESYDNLVVSPGDGLTNLSYEKMLDFHKKNGAFATVALVPVPIEKMRQYGAVSKTDANKITRFYEKADPKELPEEIQKTPLASAGIYIFDKSILKMLAEMEKVLDWGHDFFSKRDTLAEEFPEYRGALSDIFGFSDDSEKVFWDDIGTIQSYRDANMMLIDGIHGITTFSRKVREQESNVVKGTVRHSLIGRGCEIHGTVEDCVIGNDVVVGKGSHLKGCILNSEAKIGDGVEGESWIIDRLGEIKEGSEVGKYVVLGRASTVFPGAKVKDNAIIGAGVNIEEDVEGEVSI
jgi:glucose-1-phosphate adenylyltransferase